MCVCLSFIVHNTYKKHKISTDMIGYVVRTPMIDLFLTECWFCNYMLPNMLVSFHTRWRQSIHNLPETVET